MKSWSRSWKSSKNPRKQRKYVYNAPLHIIKKFMSARLTKELKEKYGKRNIPVRKGDRVKIVVGKYKGKISKVSLVDLRKRKVYIEDIFVTKRDGNKVPFSIYPSNLMIVELNLDDKLRKRALERE